MIRGRIERENIPEHKRWLWDFRDYEDYKDDKYVYGSKSSFGRKEEATLYTSLSATKGMVTKFKKEKYLMKFIKDIEIIELKVIEVKTIV